MRALLRATLAIVTAVLLAAPTPVAAQDIDTMPVPLVDVSAGYAFMRDMSKRELTEPFENINFPAGWYTSAAFNPNQWFGIVGEVSGNYQNDLNLDLGEIVEEPGLTGLSVGTYKLQIYTALGGARFFRKFGRVVPFGQILAGVVHVREKGIPSALGAEFGLVTETITENNLGIQPGGGVTVYLTKHMGARIAADYRSMIDFNSSDEAFEEGTDYYNALRVIGGFTLQWGR